MLNFLIAEKISTFFKKSPLQDIKKYSDFMVTYVAKMTPQIPYVTDVGGTKPQIFAEK